MHAHRRRAVARALDHAVLALLGALALAFLALQAIAPRAANAAELVPQLVVGGALGSQSNETSFAIALRSDRGAGLQTELAAGLRFGDIAEDGFRALQSPITASLWATPLQVAYVGGGVGWYPRDLWRETARGLEDPGTFGLHAGGGLHLPVIPSRLAVDVGTRWIFRGKGAASRLFGLDRADAFATTAGLAITF
jgi:hypothetical protein